MIATGREIKCDVCGCTEFQEAVETIEDTSDGLKRMTHYADTGWKRIPGIGDTCPECAKAYYAMVESFVEERGGVPDESNNQN